MKRWMGNIQLIVGTVGLLIPIFLFISVMDVMAVSGSSNGHFLPLPMWPLFSWHFVASVLLITGGVILRGADKKPE